MVLQKKKKKLKKKVLRNAQNCFWPHKLCWGQKTQGSHGGERPGCYMCVFWGHGMFLAQNWCQILSICQSCWNNIKCMWKNKRGIGIFLRRKVMSNVILEHCCQLDLFEEQTDKSIILSYPKSLQSCPTLCDPIDGSPPDSPVPGILQARTLEWVAISFS